jgi:Protein of unknown function (DUF1822)
LVRYFLSLRTAKNKLFLGGKMTKKLTDFDLKVPLTSKFIALATQFAAEQDTVEKGKRVWFNTISVLAVNKVFNWVCNYEAELSKTDAFNPRLRAIFDCNDIITPYGKIDCIPVISGEEVVIIPTVWNLELDHGEFERIGYVFVEFFPHMNNVKMLGFIAKESLNLPPLQVEYEVKVSEIPRFVTLFDSVNFLTPINPE